MWGLHRVQRRTLQKHTRLREEHGPRPRKPLSPTFLPQVAKRTQQVPRQFPAFSERAHPAQGLPGKGASQDHRHTGLYCPAHLGSWGDTDLGACLSVLRPSGSPGLLPDMQHGQSAGMAVRARVAPSRARRLGRHAPPSSPWTSLPTPKQTSVGKPGLSLWARAEGEAGTGVGASSVPSPRSSSCFPKTGQGRDSRSPSPGSLHTCTGRGGPWAHLVPRGVGRWPGCTLAGEALPAPQGSLGSAAPTWRLFL